MTQAAEQLHAQVFGGIRAPRSVPYKIGALQGMAYVLGESESIETPPYRPGTAELDAWRAGIDEGKREAHRHLDDLQAAEAHRALCGG